MKKRFKKNVTKWSRGQLFNNELKVLEQVSLALTKTVSSGWKENKFSQAQTINKYTPE